MTVERDAIERRDFPVVESGYEQEAVHAHLSALAAELERLRQSADAAGSAGSQVQSVLDAAQRAAAQIEADARARAEQAGAQAAADADAQVAAVADAARAVRERLSEFDRDLGELIAAARAPFASASTAAASTRPAPERGRPVPDAAASPAPSAPIPADAQAATNGDRDGARLVALNMALSGEPRAATERYLAEHFQLRDRDALIDEVYAAVEE